MCICIHVCIYRYICIYIYVCIYTYISDNRYTCVHISDDRYTCAYIWMYIWIYTCIYIWIYIYIHIQAYTHTSQSRMKQCEFFFSYLQFHELTRFIISFLNVAWFFFLVSPVSRTHEGYDFVLKCCLSLFRPLSFRFWIPISSFPRQHAVFVVCKRFEIQLEHWKKPLFDSSSWNTADANSKMCVCVCVCVCVCADVLAAW